VDAGPEAPAEVRQIPSGQARLSVARRGEPGPPTTVFLHAGIADRRSWDEVMAILGTDTDVVAYDRRGFGATTYVPEEHDQVADLCSVLDALDLERVVLVGNSRGGEIALGAALTHPERVSALVLVAPAVAGAPPATEADVDPVEAALWESLEAADAAGALDALNLGEIRFWLDGPAAPEGRVDGARRQLALDMNRIALSAESPGYEVPPPEAWSRLSELDLPVLVVVGELDMRLQRERAAAVAERITGARLHTMREAAHLPGLEQPGPVAEIVRTFLRSSLG
jgi:pimeloyl-ACP methyl ester carboxylesterase